MGRQKSKGEEKVHVGKVATRGKTEMGKGNFDRRSGKTYKYTTAEKEQQLAGSGMAEMRPY